MVEHPSKKTKVAGKRQLLVYLPSETITALKIAGIEDDKPVSTIVETLVDKWLQRRQAQVQRGLKTSSTRSEANE